MARIIVIGGGVGGLTSAMLLARDGHEVTLLERDPAAPPESEGDAWESWQRRGVNQFRQIHYFLPRFRQIIEAELPEVAVALTEWGALRYSIIDEVPTEVSGGIRDSDAEFTALTARRPVAEAAIAQCAARTKNLTVLRGVAVQGLLTGDSAAPGIPQVVGVRTDTGDELRADLVVDAGGRRSALPAFLDAIGARAPEEEKEDCGFIYYGRHFRSSDGSQPPVMAGLLSPWGTISTLTLPSDNGAWGLGIVTSANDEKLRALKDKDTWMRVWRSIPLVAHWVDGEPIDGDQVSIMAKIEDRHRAFVVDGTPVATGVLAVADSWACTNPSVGRGASIGAMHAVALRDLLRGVPLDEPVVVATRWHEATQETVEPYFQATLDFDRHRLAEIEAGIEGKPYDPNDPAWELTNALRHSATMDPELFRAFMAVAGMLENGPDVLAKPEIFEKVVELGAGWRDAPILAPTRDELLALVAG